MEEGNGERVIAREAGYDVCWRFLRSVDTLINMLFLDEFGERFRAI